MSTPSGPSRIFVYGHLLSTSPIDHPAIRQFHAKAVLQEPATIPGKLYHLGNYPGAHYDSANHTDQVHGEIWRLTDHDILKILDHYEGIGEEFPEPTEYVRRIVPVHPEEGWPLACWVYLYNRFTDQADLIPTGKWSS